MTDKKSQYKAAIVEFHKVYIQKPKPPKKRTDYAWWQRYDAWYIRLGKAYENMKNAELEFKGSDNE